MNTEERIRAHLEATTSGVRAPDRLDEVVEEGRRRRVSGRIATVLGVAAGLALVVGFGSLLTTEPTATPDPDRLATSPTATDGTTGSTVTPTTSATAPLSPAGAPRGMITAGPDGVTVYEVGSEPPVLRLSSDQYRGMSSAFPDQRGGLVLQHSATPAAWPEGAILRLRPSASSPEVLASPEPGGRLVPVGSAEFSEGHAAFVYLSEAPADDSMETRVMVADLDTGRHNQIGILGRGADLRVGGHVLGTVDRESVDCPTLSLTTFDGEELPVPNDGCLPVAAGVAVAGDGSSLGILTNGVLRIINIAEGTESRRLPVPDAMMVTAGEGLGWLVRTPTETVLVGPEKTTVFPAVGNDVAAVPFARALAVTPAAGDTTPATTEGTVPPTTGSDAGERPCRPIDTPLADQDLPAAVAATRQAIYAAAASCDYESLAALAAADDTVVSFGAPDDLIDFWIAEGRAGNEPLAMIAQMLSTTPLRQAETGIWAWPGVHADPSFEQSWDELTPILGADTVEDLRQFGYLAMRIGIAEDGTWQFATAGD